MFEGTGLPPIVWTTVIWAIPVNLILFGSVMTYMAYKNMKPRNRPAAVAAAFARSGRRPKHVVAMIGDSHTHGFAGYNIVKAMANTLEKQGFSFVNAGYNGELSYQAINRVDEAMTTNPDTVMVLIGTNDVLAQVGDDRNAYYVKTFNMTTPPSMEQYGPNLETIIEKIRAKKKDTRIALVTLPPLGEEVDSKYNAKIKTANIIVKQVAKKCNVELLDFNARLWGPIGRAQADGFARDNKHPFPESHSAGFGRIISGLFQHYYLNYPWNRLAYQYGNLMVWDGVHLTDTAGTVMVDLYRSFLLDDKRSK